MCRSVPRGPRIMVNWQQEGSSSSSARRLSYRKRRLKSPLWMMRRVGHAAATTGPVLFNSCSALVAGIRLDDGEEERRRGGGLTFDSSFRCSAFSNWIAGEGALNGLTAAAGVQRIRKGRSFLLF